MSNIVDKIKRASDLANKFEFKLRVDGPNDNIDDDLNDKWVIDLVGEDGPADDLDNIVAYDEDLEVALDKFIEKAEDEDPDSGESDDEEDD